MCPFFNICPPPHLKTLATPLELSNLCIHFYVVCQSQCDKGIPYKYICMNSYILCATTKE